MIKKALFILILNIGFVYAQDQITFVPQAKIEYNFTTNLKNSGLNEYKCNLYFNNNASYFNYKQIGSNAISQKKQSKDDYNISVTKNIKIIDTSNHYIYTNRKEKSRIETIKLPYAKTSFLKKDTLSIIQWQLVNETKLIGDFNCKKATAHFRGRHYTAWYSTKINSFFGPLKFGQLPGLILEIYDDDKKIFFQVTKITYPYRKPVTVNANYDYITEEELSKLRASNFEKIKNEKEEKIDAVLSRSSGRDTKLSKIKVDITNNKTETIEIKTED